jgi:2-polyprenyl-3-methyl-5-hydroxy-6-metoxy-1,4-benzoquinol methylase
MHPQNESFSKPGHVCPWWLAYTFDNPIRKLFHNPEKILGPYLQAGMTVMDVGCGMGYFSIGMAKIIGDAGRVFCVDLQPKMLEITQKRAGRAGMDARIVPHRCGPGKIGLLEKVDFILVFWMVHEVQDPKAFFTELKSNLSPPGKILVAEPRMHVSAESFQKTLDVAQSAGLHPCGQPVIRFSRTALMEIRT